METLKSQLETDFQLTQEVQALAYISQLHCFCLLLCGIKDRVFQQALPIINVASATGLCAVHEWKASQA